MPLDWFTIVAQGINFLILLWLLKRFLYKPIIKGLDARENKIAGILMEAESTKAKAELLQSDYEKKLAAIAQQATQVTANAQEEAEAKASSIIDTAHQNADILVKKRLDALRLEVMHLKQEILRKSMLEVFAVSRKVLADLADTELENKMFEKLLTRLQQLDKQQTIELENALGSSGNHAVVRSIFALNSDQLTRLQQCLQAIFSTGQGKQSIQLTQSLVPELIIGIELSLSGWKLAWTAQQYLNDFQKQMDVSLELSPSINEQAT